MLTLYIITTIIGAGLALAGAFLGSHDHDTSLAHAHIDLDHSHTDLHLGSHDHGSSESHSYTDIWLPILSVRFWTFFLASFGTIGILLELLNITHSITAFLWALIGGLITGLLVNWFMRALKKGEATSETTSEKLLGALGTILVPTEGTNLGKVRCLIRGETIDLLALSENNQPIGVGEEVVIVGVEQNIVHVLKKQDVLDNH